MTPGSEASGEVRLIANPATLQRLPWHPQHAIALADLVWKPLPDKELRATDGELPAGSPLLLYYYYHRGAQLSCGSTSVDNESTKGACSAGAPQAMG